MPILAYSAADGGMPLWLFVLVVVLSVMAFGAGMLLVVYLGAGLVRLAEWLSARLRRKPRYPDKLGNPPFS